MNILVTGATGLLGSHLLHRLAFVGQNVEESKGQKVNQVFGLRRETSNLDEVKQVFSYYGGDWEAKFDSIQWKVADVLDASSIEAAMQDIDLVYHCAAIVSFDPSDRDRLIKSNIEGTKNIVNAILKILPRAVMPANAGTRLHHNEHSRGSNNHDHPTLIHISSTSALGDAPGNDPNFLVDETTPRDPNRTHSGYSVSKYESEKIVHAARKKGLKVSVVNPGIILGPGFWDKGSSKLFKQMHDGLKFYTKGGTGYVDVRDVCDVLVTKLKCCRVAKACPGPDPGLDESLVPSPESRYCLVGSNAYFEDFFNLVADELGVTRPSIKAGKFLSGLAWRVGTLKAKLTGGFPLITRETAESANRISFYSAEKVKKEFDFNFRGIEDTVAWCCGCFKKKSID